MPTKVPEWFPALVDLPVGKVLVLGSRSKPAVQQLYRQVKRLVRQAQEAGLLADCVVVLAIKASEHRKWALTIKKEPIDHKIISITEERKLR